MAFNSAHLCRARRGRAAGIETGASSLGHAHWAPFRVDSSVLPLSKSVSCALDRDVGAVLFRRDSGLRSPPGGSYSIINSSFLPVVAHQYTPMTKCRCPVRACDWPCGSFQGPAENLEKPGRFCQCSGWRPISGAGWGCQLPPGGAQGCHQLGRTMVFRIGIAVRAVRKTSITDSLPLF